jgi:hypothetical protein
MRAALIRGVALALAWGVATATAATPEEAAKLGAELTPVGAEAAGNAAGTLPPWDGGLTVPPPAFKGPGSRYVDPFAGDRPLYVITAGNLEQYRHLLTPGQLALFAQYPKTYAMPVYPARRSAAFPEFIYAATRRNATAARLASNGESVTGARDGFPFPLPRSGAEVIWNHRLRYQGGDFARWNVQAPVTASGNYTLVRLREEVRFLLHRQGEVGVDDPNMFAYYLQRTMAPPRVAGQVLLVHETIDQVAEMRRAWSYNPGQKRLRRAPAVGYDTPGVGADGLRTTDQTDSFNGALDRYTWKLVGKREVLLPVNAYRIHAPDVRYADILKPGHINQSLARYELRRAWVVDATLAPGKAHIYGRRTFYVDEDSWQIHAVDVYDRRGQLWRVQDAHSIVAYDKPFPFQTLEVVYDLQARRYLAQAMSNQEDERQDVTFPPNYFSTANVTKVAAK